MRNKVVIDANLLVLLAVGAAGKELILTHKRCRIFLPSDYDLLISVLSESSEILLTPNALTEASNLAAQTDEVTQRKIFAALKVLIDNGTEVYVESKKAVSETIYARLGLTDAALINLARQNIVIMTVDFDLYSAAYAAGCEAINFTHHMAANR